MQPIFEEYRQVGCDGAAHTMLLLEGCFVQDYVLWQDFYSVWVKMYLFILLISVLLLCAKHQAGLWGCRGEYITDLHMGNLLGKMNTDIKTKCVCSVTSARLKVRVWCLGAQHRE